MNYAIEQMSEEFTKFHLNPNGEAPWPFRPVIHHFTGPDKGGPHCHPWPFTTHIISGSHIERVWQEWPNGMWDFVTHRRKAGTSHTVAANCIHEIIALPEGECYTFVTSGPKEREPRFWRFEDGRASSRQWNEAEYNPHP